MTSDAPTPQEMLRLYRERSPVGLNDHAETFLKMSDRHRSELLFYMMQHINMAMQQRDDASATAFKDVERYLKGGDA